MAGKDEKIQIVAFSTNDTKQNPIDIINMFLEDTNHIILKKSRHAIAFTTTLPNSSKTTNVMVCSVLNITKEYTGITDVNCYIIFIDLEKKDSKEKFESIFNYTKDYCDLTKKIYIFGMVSENIEENKNITKEDITKILDSAEVTYEYKEVNLYKEKEVSETIMDVLIYSSNHSISGEVKGKNGDDQGSSCEIF